MLRLNRKIYTELLSWKNQRERKPLLLFGARQVGKTFLLTDIFGPNEFKAFHVLNFKEYGASLSQIFASNFDVKRILSDLSILLDRQINLDEDLIVLDEVQECPAAVESLKYFYERHPNSFIIATGSMLRIRLLDTEFFDSHQEHTFNYPVGKVTELTLYPLSFEEFLWATASQLLVDEFAALNRGLAIHEQLIQQYRDYLFVGGMPEAVTIWADHSLEILDRSRLVRQLQHDLVSAYKRDFVAKGNLVNGSHLNLTYDALFTQVQHAIVHDESANRFKFKGVVPRKSRFDELRSVIDWLENAGLVHKVFIIDAPPLLSPNAFIRHNIFKLIPHDIGLVNAKLQHTYKEIRIDQLGLVKGALAEIFVANELKASVLQGSAAPLVSWTDSKGGYEIEFLLKTEDKGVVPIEVKGGFNTASTSLNKYQALFKPDLAVKLSARPGGIRESTLLTLPIYYAGKLSEILA